MVGSLNSSEESQLAQTIEMFEVITQTQPQDYQSLEILKEAYVKLSRDSDVLRTSKRIAQAYVLMGQLSSAILEYESILQRNPDDPDVLAALGEIESKANSLNSRPALGESEGGAKGQPDSGSTRTNIARKPAQDLDDGRQMMTKIFVEGRLLQATDFDLYWPVTDLSATPDKIGDPFIQVLVDKGVTTIDKCLKLISDKSRLGFVPLDKYDLDVELGRTFPADICRRWCILPFDRMSKSIFVATANPFNRQAAKELEACTDQRLLWFLAPPPDIIKALKKIFR
jgi:tetratricopeptide (TPR) repeat protein